MHIFTGVSASPGVVIGPVEQIDHGTTGLHRIVCDPFRERALYDVAVVLAKDELRRLSQRAKGPDADILLFPDIHAGNLVYKAIVHMVNGVKNGCILTGTQVPAILTSRSDTFETKVNSIALAAVVAEELNKKRG